MSCSPRVDETVCLSVSFLRTRPFDGQRFTACRVRGAFESRLQRPFRPSSRSQEDHRLAKTRLNCAFIAPQEPAVPFSFSRSLRTGPLVDSRQFRTPPGHNRPARPDYISGLLTNALKTQSHTSPPFFSSLGWTTMERPEIRLTIAIAVSFSSSMSWTICPSRSAEPISCSRLSPPVMNWDRS